MAIPRAFPRATLSSDPAGVNRGSPRLLPSPGCRGDQRLPVYQTFRVSRPFHHAASRPTWLHRSDDTRGKETRSMPESSMPALTPDQMSRVDRIMGDDFGVGVLQ